MNQNQQCSQDRKTGRIIVVDDDKIALKNLRRILEKDGHRVSTFNNPLRVLKQLEEKHCDLIITDLKMPYLDGISLLNKAKLLNPSIEVILITGYASLDGAIRATRQGAFYYLEKPFTPERVRALVAQALEQKTLKEDSAVRWSKKSGSAGTYPVIIGKSPRIAQVEEVIRQIAPSDSNVLITGESGTGKELAARSVHVQSHRAQGPFVAFNCGAFNEALIANEIFGHEKEAFTGASSRKQGLLETANKGTVFLDEIGEMPASMQVKLLRVIQEREFLRVGGTRSIPLDVRFITATAKDLKAAVSEGVFRQDLYFRLNVVNIVMPRLSERRQDIPLLAYYMLEKYRRSMNKDITAISRDALELLKNYTYPGNVRELENIIERAVAVCREGVIKVSDLPSDLSELKLYSFQKSDSCLLSLEELEQDYIRHILKTTGGARTQAAEILGIDRASLWRKIKKYSLE
ncbi:MAG: sigma-54-dependent Fis family transcriptional regulator [Deltaproteobacteria bacterium]|nr:sigma-54-dependent Fis family transcriptional regulator [Deltaproteobacteria bacterium]